MTFEVTILGCGAATPTMQLHPSSQVVNLHDRLYLVDCGEGTQSRLRENGIRFQKINHVFITHLHGDHYFGLIGYLSSMHLLGRKSALHIYAHADLRQIVELNLLVSQTFLSYELLWHPLRFDAGEVILEEETLRVRSVPLKHRIDCCGFVFEEKPRPLNVKPQLVKRLGIKPSEILKLKKGLKAEREDGTLLDPKDLCTVPPAPRSYAYIADTAYSEKIASAIGPVNLLYHESTFLNTERERAKKTFHSTAEQAAKMAVRSKAARLLLGHFSSRYHNLEAFADEAQKVFPDTEIAREGVTYKVEHTGTVHNLPVNDGKS